MHPPVRDGFGAKPRTHRRKARQQFLAVAKKKRPRINKIRKAIKQQLAHLERNLTSIDALIACGTSFLAARRHWYRKLLVMSELVRQRLDPYNEGEDLRAQMFAYSRRHGHYSAVICADQVYRIRSNRVFCASHKIRLSGPRLGRPKSDPDLVAEEKRQFIDEQRRRNAFEGRFGPGKSRFGLGLIREKLALTQGSTIAMNILVMNIEKLLELLFVLFTCWLHLLWARGSVNNAHSDLLLAHGVMA